MDLTQNSKNSVNNEKTQSKVIALDCIHINYLILSEVELERVSKVSDHGGNPHGTAFVELPPRTSHFQKI